MEKFYLKKRLIALGLAASMAVSLWNGMSFESRAEGEDITDEDVVEEGTSIILNDDNSISVVEEYTPVYGPDDEADPMYIRSFGDLDGDYYCEEGEADPGNYGIMMLADFGDIAPLSAGGGDGYNAIKYGVDVSKWQEDMDWTTAKNAGVEFAFIRTSYRTLDGGTIYDDEKAVNNINGASAAGIQVGLYIFSQAINVAEAEAEAQRIIDWANAYGAKVSLPLVMDLEYGSGPSGRLYNAHLSRQAQTDIAKAFSAKVKAAGYHPMVYANKDFLENHIYPDQLISAGCPIWLARYKCDTDYGAGFTDKNYVLSQVGNVNELVNCDFEFWQCSSKYKGSTFGAQSDFIDFDYWFLGRDCHIQFPILTSQGDTNFIDLTNSEALYSWNNVVQVKYSGDSTWYNFPASYWVENGQQYFRTTIHEENAEKVRISSTNRAGRDVFCLEYKLNYDPVYCRYNSASLDHIEDFRVKLTDLPDGYVDNHMFFDEGGRYGYESIPTKEHDSYLEAAAGPGAKTAYIHAYADNSHVTDVNKKKTFNLTFDKSDPAYYKYVVGSSYEEDYKVRIEIPSSDYTNQKMWIDGYDYSVSVENVGGKTVWAAQTVGPYHSTFTKSKEDKYFAMEPHQEVVIKAYNGSALTEQRIYTLSYDDSQHKYVPTLYKVNDFSITIQPPSGYTEQRIWLDGIPYNATVTADGKWKVELGSDVSKKPKVATLYRYNSDASNPYPNGMHVYFISYDDLMGYTVTECPELTDFLGYAGYSVKLGGENGLRCRAQIKNSVKSQLTYPGINGYKLTTYGMVCLSDTYFDESQFVIGGAHTAQTKSFYYLSANKIKEIRFGAPDSNYTYYTVYYKNMPVEAYKRPMHTRPYAIVEKNGVQYVIYAAQYQKDLYSQAKKYAEDLTTYPIDSSEHAYLANLVAEYEAYERAQH